MSNKKISPHILKKFWKDKYLKVLLRLLKEYNCGDWLTTLKIEEDPISTFRESGMFCVYNYCVPCDIKYDAKIANLINTIRAKWALFCLCDEDLSFFDKDAAFHGFISSLQNLKNPPLIQGMDIVYVYPGGFVLRDKNDNFLEFTPKNVLRIIKEKQMS